MRYYLRQILGLLGPLFIFSVAVVRIGLDLIGYSTLPDDWPVALKRGEAVLSWLMTMPSWLPLLAAFIMFGWYIWWLRPNPEPAPTVSSPLTGKRALSGSSKSASNVIFEFGSFGFDLDSEFRHSVEQNARSNGSSEYVDFEDLIVRIKSNARLDDTTTRLQINSDNYGNELTLEPVGGFSGVVGPGQECSIRISRRNLGDGTIVLLPNEKKQARPKIGSIYEVKLQVFHSKGTEEAQFRVNFRSERKHPSSTIYQAENIQLPVPRASSSRGMFVGFQQPKLTFSDAESVVTGNVVTLPLSSSTVKET